MNLSSIYLRRCGCLYMYPGPTLLPEAVLSPEAASVPAAYCFCFLKCPNCCSIKLFLHHAFRHSQASIMSSSSWFLSGVMSFFALLKTRSHSVDIAGQDRVSRAYWKSVGKLS